jgi:hypothetical protein
MNSEEWEKLVKKREAGVFLLGVLVGGLIVALSTLALVT